MVGRVGYAPTTPAMSMQYSTIELTALIYKKFRVSKAIQYLLNLVFSKGNLLRNSGNSFTEEYLTSATTSLHVLSNAPFSKN